MKANIHPNWQECRITCACGNSFITRGNTATLQVDICNKCHPFFTGEERFVDKEGRLDKFKNKMALSKKLKAQELAKQKAKQAKKDAAQQSSAEVMSFKQILNQTKGKNNSQEAEASKTTQAELMSDAKSAK